MMGKNDLAVVMSLNTRTKGKNRYGCFVSRQKKKSSGIKLAFSG